MKLISLVVSRANSFMNWPSANALVVVLMTAVLLCVQFYAGSKDTKHHFPLLNPKRFWEFSSHNVKKRYDANAQEQMTQAAKTFGKANKPFRLLSFQFDNTLVLPPHYANEIRNDKRFSFASHVYRFFHGNIRGFNTVGVLAQKNRLVQTVTQDNITQAIPQLTPALSKECAMCLEEQIANGDKWQEIVVKDSVLPVIARLSTRIFLGEELCRNPDWLRITSDFTMYMMMAGNDLFNYPRFIRPLVNEFLPSCRRLRDMYNDAAGIIDGELARRRKLREAGEVFHDSIEWNRMQHEKLGGEFDPTATQLALSFAAIHTTSDLLTETILRLAQHRDLFVPLRKEITEALRNGGVSKASFYEMKLLDSVIKETQRLAPIHTAMMTRDVIQDATLSGGIHLKRGSTTLVMPRMRDPELYEDPDAFDGHRFYKLRQQPGKENASLIHSDQLVSISSDYLIWGYGWNACPGRFLAAHEIKLALCHLIMKYDWKLAAESEAPQRQVAGNNQSCDPFAKISIRRLVDKNTDDLLP